VDTTKTRIFGFSLIIAAASRLWHELGQSRIALIFCSRPPPVPNLSGPKSRCSMGAQRQVDNHRLPTCRNRSTEQPAQRHQNDDTAPTNIGISNTQFWYAEYAAPRPPAPFWCRFSGTFATDGCQAGSASCTGQRSATPWQGTRVRPTSFPRWELGMVEVEREGNIAREEIWQRKFFMFFYHFLGITSLLNSAGGYDR